jgi:hypothetical protein
MELVLTHLLRRIREEFQEVPGLCLTVAEASRFWALDPSMCEQVLTALASTGFLTRGMDERYRLAA